MIPHGAGVNHAVSQTCHCLNESMGVSSEGVNHTLLQTCCCLLHGPNRSVVSVLLQME